MDASVNLGTRTSPHYHVSMGQILEGQRALVTGANSGIGARRNGNPRDERAALVGRWEQRPSTDSPLYTFLQPLSLSPPTQPRRKSGIG